MFTAFLLAFIEPFLQIQISYSRTNQTFGLDILTKMGPRYFQSRTIETARVIRYLWGSAVLET